MDEKEIRLPRTNKRVSLFRKRKKPKERKIVTLTSQRNYKRLMLNVVISILAILIIVVVLIIIRFVIAPKIFVNSNNIIAPQAEQYPDENQVKNFLQNAGLAISDIKFASDSSTVVFYFKKNIQVMMSTRKNITGQLDLIEMLDRQLESDGKQAIYIDLRYNKPIVKIR